MSSYILFGPARSSMTKYCLCLFVACLLFLNQPVVRGQKEDQKARLFDSYGWIGSEDASARLDNFAIKLLDKPEMTGYLICYGPEGDGSGTGNHLLRAQKDYLLNTRGLEPERIQTIYSGRYQNPAEVLTELWIVPQGATAPEQKHYKSKLETIKGKFAEYKEWDGFPDGGDGPRLGNVTLASFADILRQQPKALAYIVAFNLRGAAPGTWRRVAKQDASELKSYGIEADRIKIIYGGIVKGNEEEDIQQALVQLWVLPTDAPPPVEEAKPERTPKEAVELGSYNDYILKYPEEERRVFEGFADVLRADGQLNVCLIVRARSEGEGQDVVSDGPPNIDPLKLAEQWKSELIKKHRINETRITVLTVAADDFNEGTLEVWVVPAGAALPDPYTSNNEPVDDENPTQF